MGASNGMKSVEKNTSATPFLAHIRSLTIGLSQEEMQTVLEAIKRSLAEMYVHLPQKVSAYGTNPLQELEVLTDIIPNLPSEGEFIRQIQKTTHKLFDRHTGLVMPSPWKQLVAFLPIHCESCWSAQGRKVLVTRVFPAIEDETGLHAGAEVTHWNGVQIGRYIENLSWVTDGANPYARIALALRSLTVRPLGYFHCPDEDWVTLTVKLDGTTSRNITLPWRVYDVREFSRMTQAPLDVKTKGSVLLGIDNATAHVNAGLKDLFSCLSPEKCRSLFKLTDEEVTSINQLPKNLNLNIIEVEGDSYGYIRIFSFDHHDSVHFYNMFAKMLSLMPERVIIDLRANPGGTIPAGESILQLLCNQEVQFSDLQFRSTKLARKIVNKVEYFSEWRKSINLSVDTGQEFSQGIPLTKKASFPELSSSNRRKAVLIVDALAYSTTDFFTAGFLDNNLGPVIGVDKVTGAGGANVWTFRQLQEFAAFSGDMGLPQLPRDFDFNLSVRRALRAGEMRGLPLEGLGAEAHFYHKLTQRDIEHNNDDLIKFATTKFELFS